MEKYLIFLELKNLKNLKNLKMKEGTPMYFKFISYFSTCLFKKYLSGDPENHVLEFYTPKLRYICHNILMGNIENLPP